MFFNNCMYKIFLKKYYAHEYLIKINKFFLFFIVNVLYSFLELIFSIKVCENNQDIIFLLEVFI